MILITKNDHWFKVHHYLNLHFGNGIYEIVYWMILPELADTVLASKEIC